MGSDYYETIEDMDFDEKNGTPKLGIGDNCEIRNAIIDKNCRIGNNVKINGGAHLENSDHDLYTVKDGIVVVKKGSIVPDGFTIE
jgi:glucose-1-phosphate adenylyltransferase